MFSWDFIVSSQISIFLVNVLKSMQILAYFWKRNFPNFKFDCFVSLETSELIAAFESKVPFFRGHGLGVRKKKHVGVNAWLSKILFHSWQNNVSNVMYWVSDRLLPIYPYMLYILPWPKLVFWRQIQVKPDVTISWIPV